MPNLRDRGQFLNLSGLFEGGLIVVALAVGWLFDVNPVESLTFDWAALLWGFLAAIPIFGLFLLFHRFPLGPMAPIKRFLIEMLGPMLSVCRWFDLVLLALLAGLAEEVLFRGLLQPWMERSWGATAGLAGSNVLFGLAHLITPLYAVVAGLIGLYLGFLLDAIGERNLLVPVVTHAVYDYLAFLVVLRAYRQEQMPEPVALTEDLDENCD